MNFLTNREKDTCTYTGVFGILFSLTCLVQHFMYTNPHWITAAFVAVYLYSIFSFSLLAAQRHPAPFMLIINACLLLLKSGIFSLVVVLTFIYTGVIAVLSYMFEFSLKFKQKLAARREEKALWEGKI